MRPWQNSGAPASGSTAGTLRNEAEAGALLWDTTNGVMFVNEGTRASPYWTPVGYEQRPLFGVHTDFRGKSGKALADTAATATIAESGLRVFGQGVEVNGDSGLVVQTSGEGGALGRIHATNQADHLIAIGMDADVMQPDQHQMMVLDVILTNVSAITNRAMFIGFSGSGVDALDPIMTFGTTTVTFTINDLVGLCFSTDLTDVAGLMTVSEANNVGGTQDLTAIGDTGSDVAAAATEQRFRIEMNALGVAYAFLDKAELGVIGGPTGAGAHAAGTPGGNPDQEYTPVVYLETTTDATITADVRQFATWAYR